MNKTVKGIAINSLKIWPNPSYVLFYLRFMPLNSDIIYNIIRFYAIENAAVHKHNRIITAILMFIEKLKTGQNFFRVNAIYNEMISKPIRKFDKCAIHSIVFENGVHNLSTIFYGRQHNINRIIHPPSGEIFEFLYNYLSKKLPITSATGCKIAYVEALYLGS